MARGNNRNRGGLYYDDNFYDPAALIARNRNDDEWYNLGYLLGTAWGANYNQRGTEKATQEGMKILDEAQAKMKQQESTASQNERAFNAMINDQDNVMGAYKMPSNYAEANGYVNQLTEQGGEYANVAPKTKGYTDYLQETPKQTLADADYSFRADEVAPKLIAQMRADGRNDYQINAAMKALEPRLLAMDKEAKRGTVQQLAEGLFNEAGYIDMSNPNNVLSLSKILDLDPTYGALLGKMAMTRQDKELKDLQIANAKQKLTGKSANQKSIFESKEFEFVEKQIQSLEERISLLDPNNPNDALAIKQLNDELIERKRQYAMMQEIGGLGTSKTKQDIIAGNNLINPPTFNPQNESEAEQWAETAIQNGISKKKSLDTVVKELSADPTVKANPLLIKALEKVVNKHTSDKTQSKVENDVKRRKQEEAERKKREEYDKQFTVNRTDEVRKRLMHTLLLDRQ